MPDDLGYRDEILIPGSKEIVDDGGGHLVEGVAEAADHVVFDGFLVDPPKRVLMLPAPVFVAGAVKPHLPWLGRGGYRPVRDRPDPGADDVIV